jgi:hypothetical protein
MSLKNDLMYPFGNPLKERLENHRVHTALNNVLKLARDKIRYSRGEMEEILLSGSGGGSSDDVIADQSVKIVEEFLNYINGEKENNTN